jgi:hypothetical protein
MLRTYSIFFYANEMFKLLVMELCSDDEILDEDFQLR